MPSHGYQDPNNLVWVGIDISKASLDVYIGPTNRPRVSNDTHGFQQLRKALPTAESCRIVIESTGNYGLALITELVANGYQVACVNPRRIKDFAGALDLRSKTDRGDAEVIAQFGRDLQPAPVVLRSPDEQELEQLVTRRRQLIETRTAESNRMAPHLSKTVKNSLNGLVDAINQQITQVEAEIQRIIRADDERRARYDLLESTPGVGPATASMLLADLPELGQLNRQEVAAIAGLAPYNRDSGHYQGKRFIKGGRPSIRSTLYMATVASIRFNPVIKAFYKRLKQSGKPSLVAVTACMRKLLIILNTMVKTNTPWQPTTCQAGSSLGRPQESGRTSRSGISCG